MSYPFQVYCLIPGIMGKNLHLTNDYREAIIKLSQLAEHYDFTGGLIHFNHHVLNPWVVATTILEHTHHFMPLIAMQPNAIPPYTAAKMVEGFAVMYGRAIALNLVAGAAKEELEQVGDYLSHDERYARMAEYIEIIRTLLSSDQPMTFTGSFYHLTNAVLAPGLPEPQFLPKIFIAGSSSVGLYVASRLADVVVTHPEPIDFFLETIQPLVNDRMRLAIRLGIIARPTSGEAWEVAKNRFPPTRQGTIKMIMKRNSESHWIKRLAELGIQNDTYDEVYWMGAYQNGNSYCAYLVGSYKEVARYLSKYLELGVKELLIDGPYTEGDFFHLDIVLKQCVQLGEFPLSSAND